MGTIEHHPPERRASRGIVLACPGSCCCCCCCLHSLGGIIGAAMADKIGRGKSVPREASQTREDVARQDSMASASRLYWWTFLVLSFLVFAGGVPLAVVNLQPGPDRWLNAFLMVGVGVVFFFPILQLAASAIAALLLACRWPRARALRSAGLGQLARIALGVVVGVVAAIIAMGILFAVLNGGLQF